MTPRCNRFFESVVYRQYLSVRKRSMEPVPALVKPPVGRYDKMIAAFVGVNGDEGKSSSTNMLVETFGTEDVVAAVAVDAC